MADIKEVRSIGETIVKNETGLDMPNFFDVLPHAEAANKGVELIYNTFRDNFYRYNEKIENVINQVDYVIPVTYEGENENEKQQKKVDEFMKFLLNAVAWDPEYDGFRSEKDRVSDKGNLLIGEEAFTDRLFKSLDLLKKSSLTKNNLFISSISKGSSSSSDPQIDYSAGANSDYMDIIDYENAFEELKYYEIKNGVVRRIESFKDTKTTMGYSKIQKDFMRYLVHSEGLLYSKNNFSEILPLRLASIFMRRFEHMMDSLIDNKENMQVFKELYQVQLAVSNPSGLRSVSEKIEVDKESKYTKYVTNDDVRYSDFSVRAVVDEEGKINHSATLTKYPEYVKSSFTDEKTGNTTTRIYRRSDYQKFDPIVHYVLVSRDTRSNTYSIGQTGSNLKYDIEEAFRPDIRNIQVRNPKNGLGETSREIKKGTIISLTAFSDPARQYKVYFEVGDRIKIKDSDKFKYDGVIVKAPESTIVDRTAPLESRIELERIVGDKNSPYSELAKMILNRAKDKDTLIHLLRTKKGDFGYSSTTLSKNMDIAKTAVAISVDIDKTKPDNNYDQTIIHEHIHRYTDLIFELNETPEGREKLSESDLVFIDTANKLWELYKQNPHKEFKDANKEVKKFITYGLTDGTLIEHLEKTKVDDKSLLDLLIDAIIRLFGAVEQPDIAQALEASFEMYITAEKSAANMVTQGSVSKIKSHIKGKKSSEEDAQTTIKECGI